MEKLTPLHHLNLKLPPFQPPVFPNPLVFRNHSTIPCVFGVRDAYPDPPVSSSCFTISQRASPDLGFPTCFQEPQSLYSVRTMHAQIIKMPDKWNSNALAKNLITSYLGFGDFRSAVIAFFMGCAQSALSWNYFLRNLEKSGGDPLEILEVFQELYSKGLAFESRALASLLRICSALVNSWLGVAIHALLIKRGLDMDSYLKCALMDFYGRCWGADSADRLFYDMPQKDDLLWNEAVMVNLQNERLQRALCLFREMQLSFIKPNSYAIVKMLQACGEKGALNEGKEMHGYVLRSGLILEVYICNSMISMYAKNNKLILARIVFETMKNRNLSSWNSIISGYTAHGYLNDAWDIFKEMKSAGLEPSIVTWNCLLSGYRLHGSNQEVLIILKKMQDYGFSPDSTSIATAIQAISELGHLNYGKEIHAYVIRNGLNDIHVETSLVNMYVKENALNKAQAVFSNMKRRNVVSWNVLVSGYASKGLFEDALSLLNHMDKEGTKPDLVTWNFLVSGYSMFGHRKEAAAMINQIKSLGLTPNVVSWTALISGCLKKKKFRDAIDFFVQMQKEGIKPNSATITCLLQACAGLSLLQKGAEIHCLTIRKGFMHDVYVATALIDMYNRSGTLKAAYKVFQGIKGKSIASWNCMIMGFATYGLGKEAISHFYEMCKLGIQPDAITFTTLLSACKNSGLVDEGWKVFDSISTKYEVVPTIEHYSCMVDLLARANYLDEALDLIEAMPLEPDATIWGALLGSSRIHKNLEVAEIAAEKLFELEPYNSANYVLMANLYALSKRWKDAYRLGESLRRVNAKNHDAWSWIQISQIVHLFSAQGMPHPEEGEIYFELYHLLSEMKRMGYVPDISSVYQNVDEIDKEKMLLSHTEKLAITYGLMKIKNNGPIRVIKNTRVCSDCHTAAKYMTLVTGKEIFLKDGVRFHHFKDGKCSCRDYW